MPKRRGGQSSGKARKGTAEPDAEHSGSEDEPMGEPPLVTPYTRLVEAEAQTHLGHGDADALLRHIAVQKVLGDAVGIAADPFRYVNDKATQPPRKTGSVWAAVQFISGYPQEREGPCHTLSCGHA